MTQVARGEGAESTEVARFLTGALEAGKAMTEGKGRPGMARVLEMLKDLRDVRVRCPEGGRTGERSLSWRQRFGTGEPRA